MRSEDPVRTNASLQEIRTLSFQAFLIEAASSLQRENWRQKTTVSTGETKHQSRNARSHARESAHRVIVPELFVRVRRIRRVYGRAGADAKQVQKVLLRHHQPTLLDLHQSRYRFSSNSCFVVLLVTTRRSLAQSSEWSLASPPAGTTQPAPRTLLVSMI